MLVPNPSLSAALSPTLVLPATESAWLSASLVQAWDHTPLLVRAAKPVHMPSVQPPSTLMGGPPAPLHRRLLSTATQCTRPLLDFGLRPGGRWKAHVRKGVPDKLPPEWREAVRLACALFSQPPPIVGYWHSVQSANMHQDHVESYLHIALRGRVVCPCIGRAHAQQNVMLSVDLCDGSVFVRCWDESCITPTELASAVAPKARLLIGRIHAPNAPRLPII